MKRLGLFAVILVLLFVGCGTSDTQVKDNVKTTTEVKKKDNKKKNTKELSEEEYKSVCKRVKYEEAFDGRKTLLSKGEKIVFSGMIKETKISNNMRDIEDYVFDGKYKFEDTFIIAGIEHSESNGYVGLDTVLYFEKGNNLIDNLKLSSGQIITVYGEIIDNDGEYSLLCKYIDKQ